MTLSKESQMIFINDDTKENIFMHYKMFFIVDKKIRNLIKIELLSEIYLQRCHNIYAANNMGGLCHYCLCRKNEQVINKLLP